MVEASQEYYLNHAIYLTTQAIFNRPEHASDRQRLESEIEEYLIADAISSNSIMPYDPMRFSSIKECALKNLG